MTAKTNSLTSSQIAAYQFAPECRLSLFARHESDVLPVLSDLLTNAPAPSDDNDTEAETGSFVHGLAVALPPSILLWCLLFAVIWMQAHRPVGVPVSVASASAQGVGGAR